VNLESILGSKNRVRTLRALFRKDGTSGRAVAAMAGMAPSACKAALEELTEAGIVLRTPDRGRTCHEINRTHRLVPVLARLFAEEANLADRLTGSIRTYLRSLSSPPELLCVGLSSQGKVRAALSPVPPQDEVTAALAGPLRYEFGLRWAGAVAAPRLIPPEQRLWALPAGREARADATGQQRALRFFGIHPATDEGHGPSGTSAEDAV